MTGHTTLTVHHPAACVWVFVSAPWSTTCTAIELAPGRVLLVDSPVLPGEPEEVRRHLRSMGLAADRLAITHADWDHLLARPAFPDAEVIVEQRTADRLARDHDAIAAELAAYDRGRGTTPRALPDLGDAHVVTAPTRLTVDGCTLEVHPAPGHTADGAAYLVPHAGVLCCGDYLSPVESPSVESGGSRQRYRETLRRLAPLVERATVIVPGHGHPLARADAGAIVSTDLAAV